MLAKQCAILITHWRNDLTRKQTGRGEATINRQKLEEYIKVKHYSSCPNGL